MNKKIRFIVSLGLSLTFALLLCYLFQVESLIKQGYLAKAYYREIKCLKEQNLSLEQKSTQELSFSAAEKQAQMLGFVETAEIKYIPVSFDYLARETY